MEPRPEEPSAESDEAQGRDHSIQVHFPTKGLGNLTKRLCTIAPWNTTCLGASNSAKWASCFPVALTHRVLLAKAMLKKALTWIRCVGFEDMVASEVQDGKMEEWMKMRK